MYLNIYQIDNFSAYACPPKEANEKNGKNKDLLLMASSLTEKDFLKPSPSQGIIFFYKQNNSVFNSNLYPSDGPNGMIGISDTSSFEEVSESDLVELQAHKSLTSDHLSDTLSGASLSSEHKTLGIHIKKKLYHDHFPVLIRTICSDSD